MTQPTTDIWAQWLLHRRHGGDPQRLKATLDHLYPVRDRVLAHAQLTDGGTLLDVGCGDGLIAFGALLRNPTSKVIFADISQDLLDHAASLAREMPVDLGVIHADGGQSEDSDARRGDGAGSHRGRIGQVPGPHATLGGNPRGNIPIRGGVSIGEEIIPRKSRLTRFAADSGVAR